jgi:hypothetical protein
MASFVSIIELSECVKDEGSPLILFVKIASLGFHCMGQSEDKSTSLRFYRLIKMNLHSSHFHLIRIMDKREENGGSAVYNVKRWVSSVDPMRYLRHEAIPRILPK